MEKVALQQLPAGEVLITVAGTAVSELLPLPATYAMVVQGHFRCGVSGVSPGKRNNLGPCASHGLRCGASIPSKQP